MTNQKELIERLKKQPRQGRSVLDEINEQLSKTFDLYAEGAKDLAKQNAFGFLAKSAQDAYEKINVLEQRNRILNETFKTNTSRAAILGQKFDKLADSIGVNADKLKQFTAELTKILPGQAKFLSQGGTLGKRIAQQADIFRNKFNLSAAAFEGLIKNQALFAKDSNNVISGFDMLESQIVKVANKYGEEYEGVAADIAESLGTMSSEAAARFSRMPDNLAEAALKAKRLGIELDKVLNIGDNFLDVESAIANEIELQLLGAKDLNVAAIQQATYQGDALALQKELQTFVEKNGEQFKENPILLDKAASALGMQKSELLDMYATLQLNKQALTEIGKQETGNLKTFKEAAELSNTQSELDKQRDEAAKAYVKSLIAQYKTPTELEAHVMKLAKTAQDSQTAALGNAERLARTLNDNEFLNKVFGAGGLLTTIASAVNALKGGNMQYDAALGQQQTVAKNDLFIPASGTGTVISGPFGAFTMNPGDDILAAPNIREAGGSSTSALIAALSKMSFHVTNVFDGDKIKSQLEIRQGQTINNINNIA
jgi:archaellum component FlaC